MKRWAALTVGLYFLCLAVLVFPLMLAVENEDEIAFFWFAYVIPPFLVLQAFLLLIPARVAAGRPVGKRRAWIAAIVLALPMAVLVAGFFWCGALFVWGERSSVEDTLSWVLPCVLAVSWVVWAVLFGRSDSSRDPTAFPGYVSRWLLRGSILEMNIAIPSHILSRQRGDCCAPAITLLGIAAGLSVALLSFGPALFFLFVRRIREKTRARE